MSGAWINDRTHGLQFKADTLRASPPTTLEGIEKYLGSRMIRDIDPVYARKLVQALGAAVFDLIEQEPARLRQVTGIGFRTADQVARRLGIEPTATMRLRAGISFGLTEAMDQGHCGLPVTQLLELTATLLEVPVGLVETARAGAAVGRPSRPGWNRDGIMA